MSLTVHDQGPVRTLTLNRPRQRNALNESLVQALEQAILAAAGQGVRVLVLRGADGNFCAGGDIAEMAGALAQPAQGGPGSEDPLAAINARFGTLNNALLQAPMITVAVVEGAVMGGGVGLACAADFVLACHTVRFALPETALGIIPAQITPFLVARIGPSQARRLCLSGEHVGAELALSLGLVHRVAQDVDAALMALVSKLLRSAPVAVAQTKALLGALTPGPTRDQIEDAARVFAAATRGPEAAEGMAAFLEKRRPSWSTP